MSAPYYTRGSLRLAHSLGVHTLLNNRPNYSNNSPLSELTVEICVMAVVRQYLDICCEQWATSRVADLTYSHIKFHSDQLITHRWISVGLFLPLPPHSCSLRKDTELRIFCIMHILA